MRRKIILKYNNDFPHHAVVYRMNEDGEWKIEEGNFYFQYIIPSDTAVRFDNSNGMPVRIYPIDVIFSIEQKS